MAGKTVPEIYCWDMAFGALRIYLASTKKGAVRIGLALKKKVNCKKYFKDTFPRASLLMDDSANECLIHAINDFFLNKRSIRIPTLDISCTPFQWRVYKAIKKIPFGSTKKYSEIASMVGRPGGARAVGQALGKNPLPLIFP